jgi:hypothetical protein
MNKFFGTAVMAATLAVSNLALADEQVTQGRAVDARTVKVKQGGIIELRVKQGPSASLTITGDKSLVDRVSVVQDGDTIKIDTASRNWNFSGNHHMELRAELTLPNLNELVSQGVGSSDIKGFTGNEIKVVLDGAGAVTVNSNYRNVLARLGGVGSMQLNAADAEQIDVKLGGAGAITVSGSSKLLRADLGGVGSLDAKKLTADTVTLDMSGLGGATVYARNTANLKLSGLGSATVYGKPANRNAESRGMGSVSWQ